ncbi:MAG: apolipoprotein N-acyltransferase [Xanthomonadales bacterium]|jgi:apolipoprotein N-acyltransferase|nr:apolipoprotein N-acyltransferase [Xanthomonadales bacterium]
MPTLSRLTLPRWGLDLAGVLVSSGLIGLYARGYGAGWLGFVVLVPWLLSLDPRANGRTTLASAWAMSAGYAVAALGWFAAAIATYTGIGIGLALLLLILLAPLLQPQFLAFALIRRALAQRLGWWALALAAAAAWVACEWALPKLLGDTLGHGLIDAQGLRQAADLGGAALLSFALLLTNLALAEALRPARGNWRSRLAPLALAAAIPALLSGYGHARISQLAATMGDAVPMLRVGMIQSGLTDYAGLRQSLGSHEAVRQILDRHFELSQVAIEQHGAEALLWSETVYPTPFGQPKSAAGEAYDVEIRAFVQSRGLPLVFGTYDVDGGGEYNSAAFLDPADGLLGHYRKTHPFPLTEYVPAWIDGPTLRRWLPWAGTWQPGNGPRVLPLRSVDGRALEVLPLICLDAVRPALALAGARLGPQALVVLSNDAWFSGTPMGARLHLAVSRFRSIETRLPQLRVTPDGLTAFVDPSGEVLAEAPTGQPAVLAGPVPVRAPPPTLMVAWGDWFGGFALGLMLLLGALGLTPRRPAGVANVATPAIDPAHFVARVHALTPTTRTAVTALRLFTAGGLVWLLLRMFTVDGFQVNSLVQLQIYGAAVLLPLLLAWALRTWNAATLKIEGAHLLICQRHRRIEVPWLNIASLEPWRLPLPGPGVELRLASGQRAPVALTGVEATTLQRLLTALGHHIATAASFPGDGFHAARRAAHRQWLDHGAVRFGLFPMLLAIPAFRLHQLIAFGGSFGEYLSFGAAAYAKGFLIWWGAWSLGTMLTAALLRIMIEAVMLAGHAVSPAAMPSWRNLAEGTGRAAFYGLIPVWLFWRVLG